MDTPEKTQNEKLQAARERMARARKAKDQAGPRALKPLDKLIDLKILERAAEADLSDKQLARVLGISTRLLKRVRTRPDWLAIVNRGKRQAAKVVESSLFARCTGTEYDEVTKERVLIGRLRQAEKAADKAGPMDKAMTSLSGHGQERIFDIRPALIVTKVVQKRVEPDTEAIKFYLSNVDPAHWKIRTQQDQTLTRKLEFAELAGKTREELIALRDRIRKRVEELKAAGAAAVKN